MILSIITNIITDTMLPENFYTIIKWVTLSSPFNIILSFLILFLQPLFLLYLPSSHLMHQKF